MDKGTRYVNLRFSWTFDQCTSNYNV